MASPTPVSQFKSLFCEPNIATPLQNPFSANLKLGSCFLPRRLYMRFQAPRGDSKMSLQAVTVSASTAENAKKRYPGESKGFVEEMRFVAMKLHTKEQAREGEKEISQREERSVVKWEPTIDGYLRFLVDSKLVFDTLEKIISNAAYPYYAEFRNTGLERSASLAKDLNWFREQGHTIPEPSSPGLTYAGYLKELSVKDPQALICHLYNIYFAHSAGGKMVGKKGWSREEKNHCLEETEKSFKISGEVLRLILVSS